VLDQQSQSLNNESRTLLMKEFATLLFNVERFKKVYADKAALRIKNGKPATIQDAMQLADQA
jgi:hypothetical protein